MPAKNSQPLTAAQFKAIIQSLENSTNDLKAIGAKYGIKPSTVRSVRQAKTWEEYERRKAVNLARQKAARQGVATPQAKKAVRKSASKRGVVVKDTPVAIFVTQDQLRKEVRAAVELITLDFEARLDRIEAKADQAEIRDVIHQAREERKPFWRFW